MEFVEQVGHVSKTERPFLVIGYYTINTPYEKEKEPLLLSLQTLDYPYDFRGVEGAKGISKFNWQKNTQMKSKFIQAMMDEFPGQPLLYLDVDCVMVQSPEILLTVDADLAAVHFNHGGELLSGTVYFGGTPNCRKVVDEWCGINEKYPERLPDNREAWDQRTLRLAMRKVPECRFVELPQSYTWIVELTQKKFPGLAPVIMHTRGSFRFKRAINYPRMPK